MRLVIATFITMMSLADVREGPRSAGFHIACHILTLRFANVIEKSNKQVGQLSNNRPTLRLVRDVYTQPFWIASCRVGILYYPLVSRVLEEIDWMRVYRVCGDEEAKCNRVDAICICLT